MDSIYNKLPTERRPTILFVAQSKTTGGVVRVLSEILMKWPEEDTRRLLLIHNKAHGGKDTFKEISAVNNKVQIEEASLWDYNFQLDKIESKKEIMRFFQKLVNKFFHFCFYCRNVIFFYKKCIRKNVEVIFSHNGGYPGGELNRASIVGAKLARVPEKILVVHNLAVPLAWWRWPAGYLVDRCLNWAVDKIVVVSKSCGEVLRQERYFSKPFHVIYNGISIDSRNNDRGGGLKDVWVTLSNKIAFVGELAPRKGVHILLEAVSDLKCDFVVILFGAGESKYVDKLHKMVKELGIEQNVVFQGYNPYARQKLQYVDLLVLPSLTYESFGMTILEAMYWKRPVVVTDTGGMKEIIEDGAEGFVVPAGDAVRLKDAIQRILLDKDLMRTLGKKGFEKLCSKFNAVEMVGQYYKLTR